MKALTFDDALAALLAIEGGISTDAGGTNYGVTAQTYADYRRRHGLAPRPVCQIEMSEVRAIYKDNYWIPLSIPTLRADWGLLLFVQAVNLPWGEAAKVLQGVLLWLKATDGIPDGDIGPKTIAATYKTAPTDYRFGLAAMAGYYACNAAEGNQNGLIVRRLAMLDEAIGKLA